MEHFSSDEHALLDQKEDIAVAGTRYFEDGVTFRRVARDFMANGDFVPAAKYLFAKYLIFLDTDGKSFEYSVIPSSPSLTFEEVLKAMEAWVEKPGFSDEVKRLRDLILKMQEIWKKERETGKIVRAETNAPLLATAAGTSSEFGAGLEEQEGEIAITVQEEVAKIAAVLSTQLKQQTLIGIGPTGLQTDGPALIDFLDRLKSRVPALDPFLVVIGREAPLYQDHPSVLMTAHSLEEAASSLFLLGAGRMEYLDTQDGADALNQVLQSRGIPITVTHLPMENLTLVLKQILGNLAGLGENLSQSEVESFYGISLVELAGHLKRLAQVGL